MPRSRSALLVLGLLISAVFLGGSAAAQTATESVRGTLLLNGQPVVGVRIDIETADGEPVGTAVTDDKGAFFLALPAAGDYKATLVTDSLPEGVAPSGRSSLDFAIRSNQSRPLLFGLRSGESPGEETSGDGTIEWVQLLVEGIKFGLIIAMCAIGLSLIFGTTGLTNFAHGELVTLGALFAWFLNVRLGIHLIPAAGLAVVLSGMSGGILDLGLWRPLRRRGTGLIAMLVVSIGLSILLRYIFLYIFAGRSRPYADYTVQQGIDFGWFSIAAKDVFSIVLSIVVLVAVGLALEHTRAGTAMRAVADNGALASASGIDVERVVLLVWVTGGALAGLGGILLGLTESVGWEAGFQLLLLIFAGVTLGGLGTAYGALVGSLVVGIFVQMSTLVLPLDLKNAGGLLVLIAILLVRPQGILGRAERVG